MQGRSHLELAAHDLGRVLIAPDFALEIAIDEPLAVGRETLVPLSVGL
jgi:hypothetical protein